MPLCPMALAALLLRSHDIEDKLRVWVCSRSENTKVYPISQEAEKSNNADWMLVASTYTWPQKRRPTLLAGAFYGRADNAPPMSETARPPAIG